MDHESSSRVFVLTSHTRAYQKALEELGIEGDFRQDIGSLIEAVLETEECPRVIVDVHQVMAAGRQARDRLFSLADRVPILRTKVDTASGQVLFIDDLALFECTPINLTPYFRASVRIPVDLPAAISHEDDPAMVSPSQARLGDISEGGCFLRLDAPPPKPDFLHLRLSALDNALPIFCNVRWRAPAGPAREFHGIGVKFMDIKPDQMAEIKTRFIEPADDPANDPE